MGCCAGLFTPISKEDADQFIDKMTPGFPMAELMHGGVIKLEGVNGLFNPDSLLDPSWLKGKMTAEQYRKAIDGINRVSAYTEVGLNKLSSIPEMVARQNRRTQAGMEEVEKLNRQYPSVQFIYQQTSQNVQLNISNHPDESVQAAMRHGAKRVADATKTVLFIMPKA